MARQPLPHILARTGAELPTLLKKTNQDGDPHSLIQEQQRQGQKATSDLVSQLEGNALVCKLNSFHSIFVVALLAVALGAPSLLIRRSLVRCVC